MGLRNLTPEEVEFQIEHLRSEKGHRTGEAACAAAPLNARSAR